MKIIFFIVNEIYRRLVLQNPLIMKLKTLLLLVMIFSMSFLYAQKTQKIQGFAITAAEKGQNNWKEVRLMDISSGEEIKSIYKSSQEIEILNARTGQPIVKKDLSSNYVSVKKVVNLDQVLDQERNYRPQLPRKVTGVTTKVPADQPFATNSAACAYDKKHERLYYTPMGINQLRYIDLKSKTPKIYFFEDEPFGALTSRGDVPNQITRMVIASDGNGYALTNNADHLIRFTTGKKPVISDLGVLTDDPANGNNSVHNSGGYGGDMIADNRGNLYLITANRNVFKISLDSKVAAYQGNIKGLPKGFSTNGAMVEGGTTVIVASAQSTSGYYKFDLSNLMAEKISAQATVFNASDLANGTLASVKKKKDKKEPELTEDVIQETVLKEEPTKISPEQDAFQQGNITVYPNPVSNGMVKLSFANQPAGKYQIQFLDISGKLIRAQEVNIDNKIQVEEFRLPELIAKGNYLIKVFSDLNKVSIVNKLTVQ